MQEQSEQLDIQADRTDESQEIGNSDTKTKFLNAVGRGSWDLAKLSGHTLHVLFKALEGASIGFTNYSILAHYPGFQSPYGYIYVSAAASLNMCTKMLHINGHVSDKYYELHRIIKEIVENASIAAVFIEDFLPKEEKSSVAVGASAFILLATAKSLVEVFKEKPFFKKLIGKATEFSIETVYGLLVGAGISDYIFRVYEGFGNETSLEVKYGTTAALSVASCLAQLPITKSPSQNKIGYALGHIGRSAFYGSGLTPFTIILIFDLAFSFQEMLKVEDPTDFSDAFFNAVLAFSILLGTAAALNKAFSERKFITLLLDTLSKLFPNNLIVGNLFKFFSQLFSENNEVTLTDQQEHTSEDEEEARPLITHEKDEKSANYSFKSLLACSFWEDTCIKESREKEAGEKEVVDSTDGLKSDRCCPTPLRFIGSCLKREVKPEKSLSSILPEDLEESPNMEEERNENNNNTKSL
jgi:hypothetical protein